jgi:hypothetical protein
MIKRTREENYKFKHELANIVTNAEVGISSKGRRSLSSSEIKRLSRLAAVNFLIQNYRRSIEDSDFTLTAKQVRAIMAILELERQEDFGKLIGCKKSKVSKILNSEQDISKPQAQLALERLAMELVMPGSSRKLLGISEIELTPDKNMQNTLNSLRYGCDGEKWSLK